MPIFTDILFTVAGLVINMMIMLVIEGIGHRVYPAPTGMMSFEDKTQVKRYISTLPYGAKFFVLFAEAAAVFCSCTFVTYYTQSWWCAFVIGVVVTFACIMNLQMIPGHPKLFSIVYLAIPLCVSHFAQRNGVTLFNLYVVSIIGKVLAK